MSWVELGGGVALHHLRSGKTHFINEGAALLLQRVLADPRDVDDAAARLAGLQDAMNEPQFVTHVGQLILRLEELGLVERVAD